MSRIRIRFGSHLGAYDVRSTQNCELALAEIASGKEATPEEVRFLLKVAEFCHIGTNRT
jgi:hypothetical protein